METVFITFRSVTPAQRGEGTLRKAGIRCALTRTPREMEERGCGYCIRMKRGQEREAVRLLREGNVSFKKVYLHHGNGDWEELVL